MSIATLQKRSKDFTQGNQPIHPGQPVKFSEAASIGDFGDQGDVRIELIENFERCDQFDYTLVTKDGQQIVIKYERIKHPTELDLQLVPGNTVGSKHCLDSLTCDIYRPEGWSHDASYNEYCGPILYCETETTITHPTHGPVTLLKDSSAFLSYPRVLDIERQKERRQLD